jgi:hypothetical protein
LVLYSQSKKGYPSFTPEQIPQKFVGVEKLNASQPSTIAHALVSPVVAVSTKVASVFISDEDFPVPDADVASPEDSLSQNALVTIPTRAPETPPTVADVAVAESVIRPME